MYRGKMRSSIEQLGQDVNQTPHFETRVGKRRWNERRKIDRKVGRG
jgi:hypothetical protein